MSKQPNESTLAALLREKPRRGRPRRAVSRQNVYVALTAEQKQQLKALAEATRGRLRRADIPDLAVSLLTVRLEALRRSLADRNQEMPEGVTDLLSLYLLWDLPLPDSGAETKWTTIRVSPQQAIELGRSVGMLHALYGVSRSEVFSLSLALLAAFLTPERLQEWPGDSMRSAQEWMRQIYL